MSAEEDYNDGGGAGILDVPLEGNARFRKGKASVSPAAHPKLSLRTSE